jgi:hypothetical protein
MLSVNETDMSTDMDTNMTPPLSPAARPQVWAPRRRSRSPSEAAEYAAYDTAVRKLVNDINVTLEDLPPLEPLEFPMGIQRQQAVMLDALPVCSPLSSHSCEEVFPKRRETDIEGDLSAAAASAELNTCETLSNADDSSVASESSDESEAVISHDTNTEINESDISVVLNLRRQKHTGEVAFSVEAPVWMWGVLLASAAAYMWMIVFMLKGK